MNQTVFTFLLRLSFHLLQTMKFWWCGLTKSDSRIIHYIYFFERLAKVASRFFILKNFSLTPEPLNLHP